ncbi:MAG: hypothetical protein HQL40_01030 [Alphaproteobacteria bacterium]|nr:hypothetical protein [Alphaproteobacteria bacterium]
MAEGRPVAPVRWSEDLASLRNPALGAIDGLAESWSAERSLELFRRMCLIRNFDLRARQTQLDKDLAGLIYLSVGQESCAAGVSMAMKGSWLLGQHRGHSHYLAFGGRPERLVDELLGMASGCCGGMGGSPPIHDFERRIVGHNGLIGDQVPVAVGMALGTGEKVVTVFGDGAGEEDYVLASMGMAGSRRLPMLFVCEDNDLSVLTPTRDRRTWRSVEVAKSFGLEAVDIADDPWLVAHWAETLKDRLPALINVRTCRGLWHVGTGSDNNADWDRWALVKNKLSDLGLLGQAEAIERETIESVEKLWTSRLQTRSGN